MTTEQIQFYGTIGFVAFTLYWLIWFWLRPNGEPASAGGVSQSPVTHGHSSPSIAGNYNTVNLNFTPATVPAPSSVKRYSLENVDALARALGASSTHCPETPIWQVVAYVASILDDRDSEQNYPTARLDIRQKAIENRLRIWGRPTVPIVELSQRPEPRPIWEPIPQSHWRDYGLDPASADPNATENPHTTADSRVMSGIVSGRYWALRVDQSKIEEIWPSDTSREPFGRRPRPGGPNDWMAGT